MLPHICNTMWHLSAIMWQYNWNEELISVQLISFLVNDYKSPMNTQRPEPKKITIFGKNFLNNIFFNETIFALLKLYRGLFPRVKLAISHHWFRLWMGCAARQQTITWINVEWHLCHDMASQAPKFSIGNEIEILTLDTLNCFKDYKRSIHILNHILVSAWPK